MTNFYKIVDHGFIVGFGTNGNDNQTEITEEEYSALVSMFADRPTAPDGYTYRFSDNPREWVLVENPEPPEELPPEEALDILLGGDGT